MLGLGITSAFVGLVALVLWISYRNGKTAEEVDRLIEQLKAVKERSDVERAIERKRPVTDRDVSDRL